MSSSIEELDVVRIARLLESERQFSGTAGAQRAPQVGDVGTVVHVLEADRAFIVEAVDPEGFTLWVADFLAEELQLDAKRCDKVK